jgi:uncharacterized protein (DUF2236 family)
MATGLFGRGIVRSVNGELAVWLFGGGRALLLQVAHPLVAAAVLEHSAFQTDPISRLRSTLRVSFTSLFGDAEQARAAVQAVNNLHARVRGTLSQATHPYAAGTGYSALDPELLLWVYATSVDSWLVAYERFVKPLSEAEREAYWTEARTPAPLWGIPPELLPATLTEMRTWISTRVDGGRIVVGNDGRALARAIFRPRVRWLPGRLSMPLELVTAWLLPPPIRDGFGYTWGPRRERLLQTVAAASRWAVPRVPRIARQLPAARGLSNDDGW